MLRLSEGINVCTDCLQKTLDMAHDMNLPPEMLTGMPNMFMGQNAAPSYDPS